MGNNTPKNADDKYKNSAKEVFDDNMRMDRLAPCVQEALKHDDLRNDVKAIVFEALSDNKSKKN
ncbi:MAG: hypothetical protein LBM97_02150 [Candidatus Nomurabacteria bacterium]|jgi:hypothetical protein|nr:hypothetical protein [Candidatus Nomurabacteria bacterium]